MHLRYVFRVYPTRGQQQSLARAFGCARVVFNDGLRARQTAREAGLPFPKAAELSAAMTAAKKTPGRCWLGEVSSVVLQQSLRDLEAAYRAFFDGLAGKRPRVGAPRFKSRKDRRQAIRFTANARWSITEGGKLALPKIGEVKVKWSRALPSVPATVTVIKDAAGRYFCSFVVETGGPLPGAGAGDGVGIDLGLDCFAVLSDGRKIDSPRFLRRAAKKLRRAQQALSRKQKGSNNRDKARLNVARAHAKVADARRDFHHRLSTELARDNQAVYVETLNVKGLARTRLAKSVHDAGWSAFTAMLEYKTARYGRTFARVGRAFPSSQLCSGCGHRDGPKPLHVRAWTCTECGAGHDRDVNAARNILNEGRRIASG
ncbi:RNA-guided endonuclease TnpB family protein [Actinomadura sp. 7K507]|uniref:RNA-guided endonuclease InsQ/TnpB family protein n=1 Tax=Actinomadura sp. 7K507 TaxID=2530365 RepID=UPI00104EB522|nr:RNA-guided endonuclease TnpB family protein [Actinomadura sp. 7K507]TDC97293.1 transposase [Actinomadura sp. 7K507]